MRHGDTNTGSGNWIQVSRLGMPLTNEAVIPIGSKDKWNCCCILQTMFSLQAILKILNWHYIWMTASLVAAVPGLSPLRIQTNSLGTYDFRNGKAGLYPLKGTAAVAGTALDDAILW